jgi:nucleotide-binding universal stress UspA family protein
MLRNILICLDGSIYSDTALELALRWARAKRTELVGLGVIDESALRGSRSRSRVETYQKVLRDEQRLQDARRRIARVLRRFTDRCAEAEVPFRVLQQEGIPSQAIVFEAEDYDLTLLGQRTYFDPESQTDPDETLEVVLRNSRRPVVAVCERPPHSRSVVVASDASPPAVRALEAFQKSELEQWQTVRVVSVAGDEATAARHAEEGARFLKAYNIPAEAQPLSASRPTAELLMKEVQELEAGMLVMGAFGRSAFTESFLSSTTLSILEKERDTLLFLHH